MHRKNPGKEEDASTDEEEVVIAVENMDDEEVPQNDPDSDSDDSFNPSDDSSDDDDQEKKKSSKERISEPEEDSDVDDDDEVIKSMRLAREKKKSNHPPDLILNPQSPSCMSFHQTEDVLAVGSFDGDLRLYEYSDEVNTLKASVNLSDGSSCREISYTVDGDKLLLAASDSNTNDIYLYDVRDGLRLQTKFRSPTSAAVSSLYTIDENVFATGDDDGHVVLWDQRSGKAYATLKVSEDCISSMITNHEKKLLACTSTDGSLFTISIRGGAVKTESEVYESEFNCIGLFKQESKLAVGNGEGSVHVFNWNEFGKHADIYTGIGRKKEPINALIPITERIILTGGEDGCIRAMNFYPQKYLGLVGQVPYSIEKMDVCNDGHLIATLGADEEVIKFWNVSYFEHMTVTAEDKVKHKAKPPKDESKSNLPSSSKQNASDFYKGLE